MFFLFRFLTIYSFRRFFKNKFNNIPGLAREKKDEFKNRLRGLKRNLIANGDDFVDNESNDNPFKTDLDIYNDYQPVFNDGEYLFLRRVKHTKEWTHSKKILRRHTIDGDQFRRNKYDRSFK